MVFVGNYLCYFMGVIFYFFLIGVWGYEVLVVQIVSRINMLLSQGGWWYLDFLGKWVLVSVVKWVGLMCGNDEVLQLER